MGVLTRVRFPAQADTSGLYFRSAALLRPGPDGRGLLLAPGESLSADTYFNCFFQQHYAPHMDLPGLRWELALSGDLRLRLLRQELNNAVTVLDEREVLGARPDVPTVLPIPAHPTGRVHFELTALSEAALLGGRVRTDAPESPVRLAACITSFRREDFVTANCAKLLADPDLAEDFEIILVDNGGTLKAEQFPDPRVRLVGNPNTGGAGGFSRGMLEALDTPEATRPTHLLIMDDDIEVPAESVLRTLAFFRHARGKVAVSGSMFDQEKPQHLHEAGARWNRGTDVSRPQPLKLLPLKGNLYVQSACGLNGLLLDEPADYGAFWFFACPADMARSQGLCLPFFVVGDDIEFGLRFTRAYGGTIRPLGGVAVWHVPFYFKLDTLAPYFFHRNLLAISALHDSFGGLTVARRLLLELFKAVCTFDYLQAHKILLGAEHFLEGPHKLAGRELAPLFQDMDAFKKAHAIDAGEAEVPDTSLPFDTEPSESPLRRLLLRLTLGGHLLPDFLLHAAPAHAMTHRCGQWRHAFGHKSLHMLHRELMRCHVRRMRKGLGLGLMLRGAAVALRLTLGWGAHRKAWREAAPELRSPVSWRRRLLGGQQ